MTAFNKPPKYKLHDLQTKIVKQSNKLLVLKNILVMSKNNPIIFNKMIKRVDITFQENQKSGIEILMFRYTTDPGCVN